MFLVTGPEMVIAACRAGLIGAFPRQTAGRSKTFDDWMTRIAGACGAPHGTPPWALNIVVHRTYPRLGGELELILKHKPALVITALGSPANVIEAVHSYGGLVFADVNSVRFAQGRAVGCRWVDPSLRRRAGAAQVRAPSPASPSCPRCGASGTGRSCWPARSPTGARSAPRKCWAPTSPMSAPASSRPRKASPRRLYHRLLVEAGAEDVMITDRVSGVPANFLIASMERVGFDPNTVARHDKVDFSDDPHDNTKAWKDIWAAGQGVAARSTRSSRWPTSRRG